MPRRPQVRRRLPDDDEDMLDSASQVGDEEPIAKRQKVSKCGIGFPGVAFATREQSLSADMLKKKCRLCDTPVGARDELQPELTRAWGKPNQSGKVCGICLNSKNRLFPHMSVSQAVTHISTDQAEC